MIELLNKLEYIEDPRQQHKANQNLNIIRKWVLSILKILELSTKSTSLKRKHFRIGLNPTKYFHKIMEI